MGVNMVSQIAVTPTITAGSYSDGDALGGRMDFELVVNDHARSGIITNLMIVDKAAQSASIDLFLFDTAFTATADNAAWPTTNPTESVIGSSCIGIVSVASGDYKVYSGGTIAIVEVTKPIRLTGTTLYAQAVVRDTPTYAATSDLVFRLTVAKD